MLYPTLKLLHLLFMATWIGAVFFASGDVRRTLEAGPEHIPLMRDRVGRSLRIAAPSAALTILTGVALIFALGGMGRVPLGIHIGLATGLLAWFVSGAGIGQSWRKLSAGLDEGADPASLAPLVQRMKIGTMAFQTLWLLTLVLMVFRGAAGGG